MSIQQSSPQCPCGSGLSRTRCCGLDLASLGAPEAARHLAVLEAEAEAEAALRHGDAETAALLVLDVLELAPNRVGALVVLYGIRKQQGRHQAAEALLRRVVALDPNHFWATNEITWSCSPRATWPRPKFMPAMPCASRQKTPRHIT